MHRTDELAPSITGTNESDEFCSFSHGGSDFDFSASFSEVDGGPGSVAPMSSADELFCNGQIRPLWLYYPGQLSQSSVPKSPVPASEDEYFDFRSSADYDFSAPQSPPASTRKEEQKKQRFELTGPSTSQASVPAVNQRRKTGKERGRSADGHKVQATSKQPMSPVTENPRRSREGVQCRRAKSLSPLRVFHIDDQARQSFESECSYSTTFFSQGIYDGGGREALAERRRTMRRPTLKELLYMADSKAISERSKKGAGKPGVVAVSKTSEGLKNRVKLAAPPRIAVSSRTSKTLSPTASPKQGSVSPHERLYRLQRAKAEQTKKRTFLPYRHGLLSCWGFTFTSCHSDADTQSYKAKS